MNTLQGLHLFPSHNRTAPLQAPSGSEEIEVLKSEVGYYREEILNDSVRS